MDLFALSLKIVSDTKAMISGLLQIDTAGKKAGATLDQVSAAAKKQDAAMRQLIESGNFYKDTLRQSYTEELKRQGLWTRFLAIEKQVKAEMEAVAQAERDQAAATNQTTKAASGASQGIGTLKSSIVQLTAQVTGLNPAVARATTVLGGLGGSAAATVGTLAGVAAGLTALAIVFRPAINAWDNAKKASDDLISSLASQGRALRENGDAATENALKFAKANLVRVQASQGLLPESSTMRAGASLASPSTFISLITTGIATTRALELQAALDAVAAAEKNVAEGADDLREKGMASDRAMADFKTGAAEILKRLDDQEKQAAVEAIRRLDERIKVLSEAMVFDDLRAKASKQLTELENGLTRAIDAGNLPLAKRIELEERLARVRAGLSTPQKSPLATEPTVGITSQGNESGAFPGFPDKLKTLPERIIPKLPPLINETGKVAVDAMNGLQNDLDAALQRIGDTLADGIYNAFAAAFNGEGIGGVFKAFGKTVLAGIGEIFTMMGHAYLEYGLIMSGLVPSLSNPFTAGPTAIAIGALLTALGAALGAIGKGSGRGTAAAGAFREPRSGTDDVVRLKFVNRPEMNHATKPIQPVVINAYGPNDPKTQRWMLETFGKATKR